MPDMPIIRPIWKYLISWLGFLVYLLVGALVVPTIAIISGVWSNWSSIAGWARSWQELLGAVIGAIIPITISLLIYPFTKWRRKRVAEQAVYQHIEIHSTLVLNDLCESALVWLNFTDSLDRFVRNHQQDIGIGVGLFNHPHVTIFSGNELATSAGKTPSIILHNMMLWSDKLVREITQMQVEQVRSFEELQQAPKLGFDIHRGDNTKLREVMSNYIENVEEFTQAARHSMLQSIKNGIDLMVVLKITARNVNKARFGKGSDFSYRFSHSYTSFKKLEAKWRTSLETELPTVEYESLIETDVPNLKEGIYKGMLDRYISQSRQFNMTENQAKVKFGEFFGQN